MSLRAEILRLALRAFLAPRRREFDLEAWRAGMRAMERFVPAAPRRTRWEALELDGLTLMRATTPASRPDRHILHLHGGGYVAGSPAYYAHVLWRFADVARSCVWSLDYPLAPEFPFPAALNAAERAWRLVSSLAPPRGCVLLGDSAGGGLALSLSLKLRDASASPPFAVVALSPWTDLALTGDSLRTNAERDPMLTARDLPELARLYLGGADPRTPYASPLYGDMGGLPPTLIQVGGDEILRDDAVRMAARLRDANPASRIDIWPRMPHAWQLFAPVLPEARRAIDSIGGFLDRNGW